MFNNISGKIKLIAKIICWVGILFCGGMGIVFIFAGAITDNAEQIGLAIVYILLGLVSWACSYLVYGFGQLIENTNALNGVVLIEDKDEEKQYKDTKKPEQIIHEDIAAKYLASFLAEEKQKEEQERLKAFEDFCKRQQR